MKLSPQQKKWGRRLLIGLCVFGLLAISANLLLRSWADGSDASDPGEATQPVTPVPAEPTAPPQTTTPSDEIDVNNPEVREAVTAAALASESISSGQFLPEDILHALLQENVVPELVPQALEALPQAAQFIALVYGYPSAVEAGYRGLPQVETSMFRVENFNDNEARVWLFQAFRITLPDGRRESKDVSMQILEMEKREGRWLLAALPISPPKDKVPPVSMEDADIRFEEKRASFEPYLRGFSPYAQTAG